MLGIENRATMLRRGCTLEFRIRVWTVFMMALGSLATALAAHAQSGTGTIRVAPTGTDSVGCGSVGSPCATLQFAVDEFPTNGTGNILVAAGTYTSSADQVVRVTRGRNISIRGGYTTAFTASDPEANLVAIDGENLRRGVLVDPTTGFLDPQITLDGVTLRNGNAPPDQGVLDSFGGGLSAFQATVTLQNLRVVDNLARGVDASSGSPGSGGGGGLAIRQATASLTDVELTGNTAEGADGSGTALRGGLGVGGGVFVFESNVTLDRVTATGNTARAGDAPTSGGSDGGGQRADGLGGFLAWILSAGSANELTATNNLAQGGQALTSGGLGLGGALFIEDSDGTILLTSTSLHGNLAIGGAAGGANGGLGGGGAIFSTDSVVSIDAVTLVSNLAQGGTGAVRGGDGGGGGLYMDSVLVQPAQVTAANLIVGQNTVTAGSGPTPGFAFGGGIFMQAPPGGASNDLTLTHPTLAENVVDNATFNQGAALYVSANATSVSSFGIVSGHATPITVDDRGEAVLTFGDATFNDTLWDGNTRKDFAAPGGTFTDNSPQAGSPNYVDASATPPDFHIQQSSAATDSAVGSTTPTDIDGGSRPFGAESDLGADEFGVPEPMGGVQSLAALLSISLLRRRQRRRRSATEPQTRVTATRP